VGNLGKRTKTGKVDSSNPVLAGGWTVKFEPADLAVRVSAEIYHAAVKGPTSSRFQMFVNDTFYGNVARGDINDLDPTQCIRVEPGDSIFFYYNTASAPAPTVSIFLREPSPI
jgi:hypothetical protein